MAVSKLYPTDRVIVGALCYVIREGHVLMLRRNRHPHIHKWTAPGGKTEIGEAPDETVRREIHEETGLTVHQPTLRGIITVIDVAFPLHWLLFLFRADDATGTARTGDTPEGMLQWIPLNALDAYPMPRADQVYLPRILESGGGVFRAKFVYDTPDTCLEEVFY